MINQQEISCKRKPVSGVKMCTVAFFALVCSLVEAAPVVQVVGLDGVLIDSGAVASFASGTSFGNHLAGSSFSRTFIFKNNSDAPVKVSGYRTTGSHRFDVKLSTRTIEPKGEHKVTVTYSPREQSIVESGLRLKFNDIEPYVMNFRASSFGVDPDSGPLSGDNKVRVVGELPKGSELTQVDVGGVSVEFRQGGVLSMFSKGPEPIVFNAPSVTKEGAADITLFTAEHGTIILPAVYTYNKPQGESDE
jgi:hypothetical protein